GWARTRIGKVGICVDLNRIDEALADAERARTVFAQHGEHEKGMLLDFNTAAVRNYLGDHQRALALYHSVLATAESLGQAGRDHLGGLFSNIGYAYNFLGDFRRARAYYEHARHLRGTK